MINHYMHTQGKDVLEEQIKQYISRLIEICVKINIAAFECNSIQSNETSLSFILDRIDTPYICIHPAHLPSFIKLFSEYQRVFPICTRTQVEKEVEPVLTQLAASMDYKLQLLLQSCKIVLLNEHEQYFTTLAESKSIVISFEDLRSIFCYSSENKNWKTGYGRVSELCIAILSPYIFNYEHQCNELQSIQDFCKFFELNEKIFLGMENLKALSFLPFELTQYIEPKLYQSQEPPKRTSSLENNFRKCKIVLHIPQITYEKSKNFNWFEEAQSIATEIDSKLKTSFYKSFKVDHYVSIAQIRAFTNKGLLELGAKLCNSYINKLKTPTTISSKFILKQKMNANINASFVSDVKSSNGEIYYLDKAIPVKDDSSNIFKNRYKKLLFYLELNGMQCNFQNEQKMKQLLFSSKGQIKAFVYNIFCFNRLSKCNLTYQIYAVSPKFILYISPSNLSSKQTIMWQSDVESYIYYSGKTIYWLKL